MFNKWIIQILIILIFQFCHSPVKPISEGILNYSEVGNFQTNGYALDLDISNNLIAVAANYDGTYLLNVAYDENGTFDSISYRDHFTIGTDFGDGKANKVVISESFGLVFFLDMNDSHHKNNPFHIRYSIHNI